MGKVLVSTDIGSDIDDALSILAMLNSGIDVRGIYTVNGNVDPRSYITKHLVNLSGKNIAVGRGESKAIDNKIEPYTHFEEAYVNDSFIDEERSGQERNIQYKKPNEVGIEPDGVKDLARKLLGHHPFLNSVHHTVFSLAPLTNIAKLLERYPEAAQNIEQLYIMGGKLSGDLEHNFRFDPIAADTVLTSDMPITIVPGDVCSKYRMPSDLVDQMNSRPGQYVKRMAKGFLAISVATEFNRHNLKDFLRQNILFPRNRNLTEENFKEYDAVLYSIKSTLTDIFAAAENPEEYMKAYHRLINILRDPVYDFKAGNGIATTLEQEYPKEISVADVYIPYCYLYPERIKIKKETARCTITGETYFEDSARHNIVTDLDFDHFQTFLRDNLK